MEMLVLNQRRNIWVFVRWEGGCCLEGRMWVMLWVLKLERDLRVLLILIKKWGILKGEVFWGCCCWGVLVEEIDLVVGFVGVVVVVVVVCCFFRLGVVILVWMLFKLDDVKKMLVLCVGLMRFGRCDFIIFYFSFILVVRYVMLKVGDIN